jgi:hypothetical protein
MNKIGREILKSLLIGIVIFIVLLVINIIVSQRIPSLSTLKGHFIVSLLYSMILYLVNAFVFIQLDKYFQKNRFHIKRLVIGSIASFLLSGLSIFVLRVIEKVGIQKEDFALFLKKENLSHYIVALIITVIVSLLIHLFYFYKSYQETRVQQEKIIAGTASAKFESLKNQIDPHFLFNSLNVLSSLIEENPENAQKFTTSLSKIYRYVLEQKDKELVTVAEELAFAKTYMNLLKMRFEDSITYEVPENFNDEDAKVVPLSLQLLLENCIKHNIVSEKKPLHIKISIKNNELIVENNKQKKEVLQDRRGVGLQNIVSRYAILTKRNVLVEDTDAYFRIKLPILTKQISVMQTTYDYNEETAYERAKKRVGELKGFYANLITYCIVIPTLVFINLKTTSFQWFWFPMLGWGLGLSFHAFAVFGYGKSWEERKVQEIMNKENKKSSWQ